MYLNVGKYKNILIIHHLANHFPLNEWINTQKFLHISLVQTSAKKLFSYVLDYYHKNMEKKFKVSRYFIIVIIKLILASHES